MKGEGLWCRAFDLGFRVLGEGVGFASPHGKSHQIFCRCAQKFPAPQLKTEERGSCDLLHAC